MNFSTPDARAMIIAAGACYKKRKFHNAYNFVQFNLATRKGMIYLRMYSDKQGGFWTKDVKTYENVDDGRYTFNLPKPGSGAPEEIKPRIPSPAITKEMDPKLLKDAYLRRIKDLCNALPLVVIDPKAVERTRQQKMDLIAVYVALNTQTMAAMEKEETSKLEVRPERETRILPALEAAARERKMVLLGDPGSGKSTFANFLSLCLAGERLDRDNEWLTQLGTVWTHGPLLPLRITLREFATSEHCDGTAAGIWDFVTDTLAAEGLADFAPYLREGLLKGGIIVLLDGLDEVADPDKRREVRDAVEDFATTYGHPNNRFLVTCRIYAYQDPLWKLDRFPEYTLAPFNQEQIDALIKCWYEEVCRLGWKSHADAQDLTQRLQSAIRRIDLMPLAKNPLQLTMMASVHFSWGRLPDDRVKLYQEMVELLLVRWQESRLGEDTGVTRMIDADKLESALEQVAFIVHQAQEESVGPADVGENELVNVLKDYLEGSRDRASDLLIFIKERAGLLIEKGPGLYTFPHRSYQEYLAGAYLAVQPDYPDKAAELVRDNYAQWREATLWSVGNMARLKKMIHVAVDVASALCPHEVPDGEVPDKDWKAASLAGEALLEIGLKEVESQGRHKQVLTRVQGWLAALLGRGVLTPVDRASAGVVLGKLGDPRPGVGLKDGLPDIDWLEVEAGPFIMGSKEGKGDEDEHPQFKCDLIQKPYYIARYPVTVAQYQVFVDSGGYQKEHYWTKEGWEWRKKEGILGPWKYRDVFQTPNHPQIGVSWYEAVAFCKWLSEQLEGQISLPSEFQWERAARHTDGRTYPWGNTGDPALYCNMDDTGIGSTVAVGIFPMGNAICGVGDMSGNVDEWCSTKWRDNYKKYKRRVDDTLEGGSSRVFRGGGWSLPARNCRSAVRNGGAPGGRDDGLGFRLSRSLPLALENSDPWQKARNGVKGANSC